MSQQDPAAEIAAAAAAADQAPDMVQPEGYAGDDLDSAAAVRDIPTDCPIVPLGQFKQKFLFLDFAGQLIELGSEFRKGELMALFGTRMAWLDHFWPQWKPGKKQDDPPMKDGFSQKLAQQGLIMACAKKGLFDRRNKERGRGAHRGDDGELVMHCGDAVIVGGRKGVRNRAKPPTPFKTGFVGGYVYPTLPALARPADEPASTEIGRQILSCLATWNWKSRAVADIDSGLSAPVAALLLLCWIATAPVGGALRNRPHGWIVGKSGAGKTTLQQFLREIMGDWAVFTEDASEAGVRQLLDQDTLAVMFDEIEAEEDNRDVVMRIVRLARLAYSGSSSLRGSSDHQAKQFIARSCFLFSSIHHHELPEQDRNRIAILQLSPFPPKTAKFLIPPQAREWGNALRRRMIEQWPRYDQTLATYQHEMNEQGYSGREQDTYGTFLACGDLLLYDEAPDPLSLSENSGRVPRLVRALGAIVDTARSEAVDISERCVKLLASYRLPAKGGETPQTVARWIQHLVMRIHDNNADGRDAIKQRLGAHGLRVVHLAADHEKGQGGLVDAYMLKTNEGRAQPMWLAVANKTNRGVEEIYAGSSWQKGVWTQSLSLIDGAWQNKKSRFGGGSPEGCVLVPLDLVCDVEGAIAEAEAEAGAAR